VSGPGGRDASGPARPAPSATARPAPSATARPAPSATVHTAVDDDAEPAALGAAATLAPERTKDKAKGKADKARAKADKARAKDDRQPRSGDGTGDAPADAPDTIDLSTSGEGHDVVYVFEPHRGKMPAVRPYLASLWARRRFVVALSRASIRGTHSSTALGSLWGLMDPLFQAAIYLFLFTVIRGGRGRPGEFIPVLLAGIFLYRLTAGAINDGGRSIRNSKDLMLTSSFPRAILPLTSVYRGVVSFVPTIFVFVPVYIIFGVPPHKSLVLLPLLFAIQIVMNAGAALLVSTAAVFIKDTQNALTYLTRILLFITPVIYPVTLLPAELKAFLQFVPTYPLFATYQAVIGGNHISGALVAAAAGWAIGLLLVGGYLFLRYEQAMASRL
jgi:teichoic acid transport system permease protein